MTNSIKKLNKLLLTAKRGFTLIETLIAIFVLMISITGPLTLAAKGLQATLIAKDQDTAFYLEQDAVEYVRFVRDTNKLSSGDWLTGAGGNSNMRALTACVSANGLTQCTVDSLQNLQTTIVGCSGTCPAINYDSTLNHFTYTTGTASIFTRTISIATPVGGNAGEASVTVTISWSDPLPHSITVREDIFNWQ